MLKTNQSEKMSRKSIVDGKKPQKALLSLKCKKAAANKVKKKLKISAMRETLKMQTKPQSNGHKSSGIPNKNYKPDYY